MKCEMGGNILVFRIGEMYTSENKLVLNKESRIVIACHIKYDI